MTQQIEPVTQADKWPGLDHIANFINALDTSDMTAKQVRTAIYSECLEPKHHTTPAQSQHSEPDPDCEYCFGTGAVETGGDEAHTAFSVACLCTATEAELAALRSPASASPASETDAIALDGYRAAVSFVSADSWDGCSDCIDVLKAAAAADYTKEMSVNDIAANLKRLRLHYPCSDTLPASASPADVEGLDPVVVCVEAIQQMMKPWVARYEAGEKGDPRFNGLIDGAELAYKHLLANRDEIALALTKEPKT